MGGSPAPSWSSSPSTEAEAEADDEAKAEAVDEANDEAEAMAVANILDNAKTEYDSSPSYIMMDSKDDRLHGYAMPILPGPNLFLRVSPFGGLVCPICTNRKARGWIKADARAHVLVRAHSP
jgi:hypothetical protein